MGILLCTCTQRLLSNLIFTGVTYNIPLTIWLRPNHPYVPPMVYVTPTRDMGIQPSQFVDTNGVVYLPYLNEWKVVSDSLHILYSRKLSQIGRNRVFCGENFAECYRWVWYA